MWWDTLTTWAQVAPVFTPIVALAALIVAVSALVVALRQLRLNRQSQRETTAKTIFREYLKLAIEYPKFAAGQYRGLTGDKREQYKWFVANFLWAVEEISWFATQDLRWRENLLKQIKYHRDYFRDDPRTSEFDANDYSDDVQRLIEKAMSDDAVQGRHRR